MAKRDIKKTFWKLIVDEETLTTLLTQIEGILNCRPLLSIRSEADYSSLTPAHLVAPLTQLAVPPSGENPKDPDYTPDYHPKDALFLQWKKHQRRLDQFWPLWSSQYLHELQELHDVFFKRHRGEMDQPPVVGELCLIKDATPRATWKLGMCEVTTLIL